MTTFHKIKFSVFFIFTGIIFLMPIKAFSQYKDSLSALQVADSSILNDAADTATAKKTTITLAAIYSNNASYYGQVAAEKMPYVALNATVQFPVGIYASALTYKLFTNSSFISAASIGAGYVFDIVKNLTGDVSYHYTFYPKNSPFIQSSTPSLLSAAINYEHLFTTGAMFDYAFGKHSDYFITLTNSKAFDIYLPDNKSIVSITPGIDIPAGTQQFYETYIKERANNGKGVGSGHNPGKGNPNQQPGIIVEEISSSKFGLMSYNFKLPVSFARSTYLAEIASQFSLLHHDVVVEGLSNTHSFFTVSLYYQF